MASSVSTLILLQPHQLHWSAVLSLRIGIGHCSERAEPDHVSASSKLMNCRRFMGFVFSSLHSSIFLRKL
jgi:hypothetical protein